MNEERRAELTDWLPTTRKEMMLRGWEEADVILFSGDAYVDHPSFEPIVYGHLRGYVIVLSVPQDQMV